MNELSPLDLMALDRAAKAKEAVMKYPHYTDEMRATWLDAIDESLRVRMEAQKAAHEAMEEAFLDHE